jgi:hypothetical protein
MRVCARRLSPALAAFRTFVRPWRDLQELPCPASGSCLARLMEVRLASQRRGVHGGSARRLGERGHPLRISWMPRPTKRQKDAAFNQQQATSAAAIGAGTAAVGLAFIPVAGPFVAAGAVVVGGALSLRALHLGRLAHDPPRDDYRLPTTVSSSALDTAGLGESDVERAEAEFANVVDEEARIVDALVVALERASGAELANDATMVEARTAEALDFAHQASERFMTSSELAHHLSEALNQFSESPAPPLDLPTTLERALPDEVATQVESRGIPFDYMNTLIEVIPERPVAELIHELETLAEADLDYARFLSASLSEEAFLEPGVS